MNGSIFFTGPILLSLAACGGTSTTYTRPITESRATIMNALQEVLEKHGYRIATIDPAEGLIETDWKPHQVLPEGIDENDPFRVARIMITCRMEPIGGKHTQVAISSRMQKGTNKPDRMGGDEADWARSKSSDPEEEEKLVSLLHMKLGLLRLKE